MPKLRGCPVCRFLVSQHPGVQRKIAAGCRVYGCSSTQFVVEHHSQLRISAAGSWSAGTRGWSGKRGAAGFKGCSINLDTARCLRTFPTCRFAHHCRFLVSQHPEVEQKIAAELQGLGLLATPEQPQPRRLQWEDLSKLQYLSCALKVGGLPGSCVSSQPN